MSWRDWALDPLSGFLEKSRKLGIENTLRRYYSKYVGTVIDTADPQGQGRIKVTCPQVLGRGEAFAEWAYPSTSFAGKDKGVYFPPDVGDSVWVWFDHGDPQHPRFSGGLWPNNSQDLTKDAGRVPKEFKASDINPISTRGIKTKRGHGLLFEDNETKGCRVEWWTGAQTSEGLAATRHHQIIMTDKPASEKVSVSTFGGHKTEWIDIAGQQQVKTETTYGLFARFLDYLKKVEIGTKLNYKMTFDELTQTIIVETPGQQKIVLSDAAGSIVISNATQNVLSISPAGVSFTTPLAFIETSTGLATKTYNGGVVETVVGGIVSTITGAILQTITGSITQTFTGNTIQIYNGTTTQTYNGIWSVVVNAAMTFVTSVMMNLGKVGGPYYLLLDQRAIALFNAHTHAYASPGGPAITGPPTPLMAIDPDPVLPIPANACTTSYVKAH